MKSNGPDSRGLPVLRARLRIVTVICCLLSFAWLTDVSQADSRSTANESTHKSIRNKKQDKTEVNKAKPTTASVGQKLGKSKLKGLRDAKKASIKKPKPLPKGIQAKAYYCASLARNQTLLSRNPDQQLPVASLTKLVTAMVTLETMKLDHKVTVPEHIKKVPKSVVGLKPGDQLTVDELLHGLLIASANDCAETLACAHPGGREKFVEAMNRKVKALGNHQTIFYTASGLDLKVEQNKDGVKTVDVNSNVSTAREMARIARAAFANNHIRKICRKKSHVLTSSSHKDGYAVRNTNKLLGNDLPVVGGKTGYTSRAGHCLATELAPGKDVVLIVVLGSPDHFRDTRLVYQKAIKDSPGSAGRVAASLSKRMARADL